MEIENWWKISRRGSSFRWFFEWVNVDFVMENHLQ
jgi:hypothetical protein